MNEDKKRGEQKLETIQRIEKDIKWTIRTLLNSQEHRKTFIWNGGAHEESKEPETHAVLQRKKEKPLGRR